MFAPLGPVKAGYAAGDLVTWDLGGGLTHIGIVVAGDDGRPLIVHNIGRGPQLEDVLFSWTITGHYRWKPRPVSPSRRAPA